MPPRVAPENRGNNKLAGFRHVALRVDSIEAAKAELEKRGVKFAEEIRPAAGGGRVLFFEDREGNLLHLVERPADFATWVTRLTRFVTIMISFRSAANINQDEWEHFDCFFARSKDRDWMLCRTVVMCCRET